MSSELLPTQTGNRFPNDGEVWLGGGREKTCFEAGLCPALTETPSVAQTLLPSLEHPVDLALGLARRGLGPAFRTGLC